ncbi:MAG: Mu-like prophage major head subunit gpT family protein [Deferribacteraceae bacterium]|jgi:phage major head subunit gpT-like protein|nr:Mu-like prophage major head subunit gpT family protein [Deferribacteraceae bacterium]
MAVVNQETLDGLTKAYSTAYNKSFTYTTSYYSKIAMTAPSTTKETTYPWLGAIPRMREWIGDKVIKKLTEHGYTIKNRKFELTVGVLRDDIEDDQYGIYTPLMEEIGRSAKIWVDELVYELVNNAFSEVCYDGQYFFDTDHPVGKKVVSNMQTGTGPAWYLLDTSRAIKPFIYQDRKKPEFVSQTKMDSPDVFMRSEYKYGVEARGNAGFGLWQLAFASKKELNAANFTQLRTDMSIQEDDEGKLLVIKPNLLVVPPKLQNEAEQMINREVIDGSNNTLYKAIELFVCPYLK